MISVDYNAILAQTGSEEDEDGLINFTTERSSFEESRRMMKRLRHQSKRRNRCAPYHQRRPQQSFPNKNNIENCFATGGSKHGAQMAGKEFSQFPVNTYKEGWSMNDKAPSLQKFHDAGKFTTTSFQHLIETQSWS